MLSCQPANQLTARTLPLVLWSILISDDQPTIWLDQTVIPVRVLNMECLVDYKFPARTFFKRSCCVQLLQMCELNQQTKHGQQKGKIECRWRNIFFAKIMLTTLICHHDWTHILKHWFFLHNKCTTLRRRMPILRFVWYPWVIACNCDNLKGFLHKVDPKK